MTHLRCRVLSSELSTSAGVESPTAGAIPVLASILVPNGGWLGHGLHSDGNRANWPWPPFARAATAIAAILVREGIDYAQSKAVFKAARQRAGLHAPPERRGGVDRLTVEEELRFLDQAYAQDGRIGLMLQTLLETGARASELVQLRIEDVSLAERVITIRHGKGGKRREVPIRRELAQLLRLHIGSRRAGPLFASRQRGSGPMPHVLTRQRVGQIVRDRRARRPGSPSASTRTCCATRWRPACSRSAWTSPTCSASSATRASALPGSTPRRPPPRCSAGSTRSTDPAAHALVASIRQQRGDEAALIAADLLHAARAERVNIAGA